MNWRQKVNRRLMVMRTAQDPGDANIYYADLGLSVARLPVDRISAPSSRPQLIVPDWLAQALGATGQS